MFELTGENLAEVKAKMQEHKEKAKRIIEPVYSDELEEFKRIELANAGRFLLKLDENARVVELPEYPDFVVELGGERFGLEHRVIRNDAVQLVGSLQDLIAVAGEVIARRRPDAKIIVNVYVKPIWIRKAQRKATADAIVDYILAEYDGAPSALPECLDKIFISPDSRGPRLVYNPGAYTQAGLTTESVLEAIEDKNEKLSRYKENTGIDIQWLLLVIGENGPASNEIFEDFELDAEIEAGFDRIYIYEDFNFNVKRIK